MLLLLYLGGEIGRRTILRGWRSQGHGSSNLLLGTKKRITIFIVILFGYNEDCKPYKLFAFTVISAISKTFISCSLSFIFTPSLSIVIQKGHAAATTVA